MGARRADGGLTHPTSELTSDVAPLNGLVRRALEAGGEAVTAMKDPTRGGLSSALHEMAEKAA